MEHKLARQARKLIVIFGLAFSLLGYFTPVQAYNTRRAQIPGEVVARVSEYFGFELPVAFPYYQGANPGAPVQNPLATTPTPTP